MKLIALAVLIAASTGNLMASGIVACYDTVGAGVETVRSSVSLCATKSNFSVLPTTDFVDWGLPTTVVTGQAYGLGTALDPIFNYSPIAHGGASWNARSAGLITAGLNTVDGFVGTDNLIRSDQGNAGDYFSSPAIFGGHFNAQPNPGAGSPFGDHLVGMSAARGPMRIDFDQPIVSVGFYISTKINTDFIATIKMYDHVNPLSSDTPILTYRIAAEGVGGTCSDEANGGGPPCNDAPFIGLDGNNLGLLGSPTAFRSIIISTNDDSGFFIDSLYLGNAMNIEVNPVDPSAPEPASVFLIGGGMVVLAMASRKFKARA